MDVLEIVEAERDRIRTLFSQMKGETGKQQRKLLFENIQHDLKLHLFAKKNILYPALRNYSECEMILKDLENSRIDLLTLIKNLSTLDLNSLEFENRIVELFNHFDDHVTREENEFFPAVRRLFRRPERETLGKHFKAAEQEREEAA